MYKLNVSDTVAFQVVVAVNDDGQTREFKIHLRAKRLSEIDLQDLQQNNPTQPTAEFLAEHITGWFDQNLIVDAEGNPADFSPDALAALLSLGGAAQTIFVQYRRALTGMGGIEGRAKNSPEPRASGPAAA